MPLGAPAVVGPASTCSDAVLVVGQLEGATVEVLQDGQLVGRLKGARGGSAVVDVDRSRLRAGRRLTATQRVGAEPSGRSPKGVEVEPALNGPVGNAHPLHRCAQSVTVANCCPGARIELLRQGAVLGAATALGEVARVQLSGGAGLPNGRVDFRQILCDGDAQTHAGPVPTAAPTATRGRLAGPGFAPPPKECHSAVGLTGIVPGAEVRLSRNGQEIYRASVPDPTLNVRLGPLGAGETLAVFQLLPRCKIDGEETVVTVAPLAAPTPPGIDGPICRGAHRITLSRLEPGAIVRVFADGQEVGRWETSSDQLLVDLAIPPGATLTARQEICGKVSPPSREFLAGDGGGRWFLVEGPTGAPLKASAFAIHSALLRNGKIVMFSGNQHNKAASIAHRFGPTQLFDCRSLTLRDLGDDRPQTDVFCSGHALMHDGRLLVAGGTESFPPDTGAHGPLEHFPGIKDCWIFDPVADSQGKHWKRHPSMRHGRWYPTLLALADGRVLAMNGHPENSAFDHNNDGLEVTNGGEWTWLGSSPPLTTAPPQHYYPRIFVGPRGEVVSATPVHKPGEPPLSGSWDPGSGGVEWKRRVAPAPGGWDGRDGFAWPYTLLPLFEQEDPEQSFRFFALIAGMKVPWIADLGTPAKPEEQAQWRPLGNRRLREHSMLVSLANGWVMLCGGVRDRGNDATADLEPEFLTWTGAAWGWASGRRAKASVPRNYHTTSLLMPDGRVFVAGSNKNAAPGFADTRREEIEVYAPWYCCHDRPRIVAATRELSDEWRIDVEVRGRKAARLVLARAGSSTHSYNSDERQLSLIARDGGGEGRYWARVPRPPVSVPGWYLLFAVSDDNVPSEGVWVKVPLR